MDVYAKIGNEWRDGRDSTFVDLRREEKIETLLDLERRLAARASGSSPAAKASCCPRCPPVPRSAPGPASPAHCFMELYGGALSLKRDSGQRVKAGCECRVSADVGSYDLHRCGHDCLYCYARPAGDPKR